MKFDQLRSIGHNLADSLASGCSLLMGVYEINVFAEAKRSDQGVVIVDFLAGTYVGGTPSASLSRAISSSTDALVALCKKHGTTPSAFQTLSARYSVESRGPRFTVTVEDRFGHHADDEYVGIPGRRVRIVDHLGRVRAQKLRKPKSR